MYAAEQRAAATFISQKPGVTVVQIADAKDHCLDPVTVHSWYGPTRVWPTCMHVQIQHKLQADKKKCLELRCRQLGTKGAILLAVTYSIGYSLSSPGKKRFPVTSL